MFTTIALNAVQRCTKEENDMKEICLMIIGVIVVAAITAVSFITAVLIVTKAILAIYDKMFGEEKK